MKLWFNTGARGVFCDPFRFDREGCEGLHENMKMGHCKFVQETPPRPSGPVGSNKDDLEARELTHYLIANRGLVHKISCIFKAWDLFFSWHL